jgi:hypothetical protein
MLNMSCPIQACMIQQKQCKSYPVQDKQNVNHSKSTGGLYSYIIELLKVKQPLLSTVFVQGVLKSLFPSHPTGILRLFFSETGAKALSQSINWEFWQESKCSYYKGLLSWHHFPEMLRTRGCTSNNLLTKPMFLSSEMSLSVSSKADDLNYNIMMLGRGLNLGLLDSSTHISCGA